MTIRHPSLFKLAAPALVFAALVAVLTLVNRDETRPSLPRAGVQRRSRTPRPGSRRPTPSAARPPSSGCGRAATPLSTRARNDPSTGPSCATPRNVTAVIGAGTLALARHDFREGLRLGERAVALAPATVRPYALIVDAQVELGRYDGAERSLQRMVDLRPNLASYARVSYFRELTGDLGGAARAMSLAVSAGSASPENVAYVQSLLGDLELKRGHVEAAADAYAEALTVVREYAPAVLGLAARPRGARGTSAPPPRRTAGQASAETPWR